MSTPKLSVKSLCADYTARIMAIATALDEEDGVNFHVETAVNKAIASLTAHGMKAPVDNLCVLRDQLIAAEHKLPAMGEAVGHARMLVEAKIRQLTAGR